MKFEVWHGVLIEYGPISHIVKLPISMIRSFSLVNHVITFAETVSKILHDFKKESDNNINDEDHQKHQILIAAAKIIKHDIRDSRVQRKLPIFDRNRISAA